MLDKSHYADPLPVASCYKNRFKLRPCGSLRLVKSNFQDLLKVIRLALSLDRGSQADTDYFPRTFPVLRFSIIESLISYFVSSFFFSVPSPCSCLCLYEYVVEVRNYSVSHSSILTVALKSENFAFRALWKVGSLLCSSFILLEP